MTNRVSLKKESILNYRQQFQSQFLLQTYNNLTSFHNASLWSSLASGKQCLL